MQIDIYSPAWHPSDARHADSLIKRSQSKSDTMFFKLNVLFSWMNAVVGQPRDNNRLPKTKKVLKSSLKDDHFNTMFICAKHIYFNGSLMWHDKETFSLLIYQFGSLVITVASSSSPPMCALDTPACTMHTSGWPLNVSSPSFLSWLPSPRLSVCIIYEILICAITKNSKTMHQKAALCLSEFLLRVWYQIL